MSPGQRNRTKVVFTIPEGAWVLRHELSKAGADPRVFFETSDSVIRLAATAEKRLVVLTPFIDEVGLEWFHLLLKARGQEVIPYLIVRDMHRISEIVSRRPLLALTDEVRVLEYAPRTSIHGASVNETFHAKIVLVDDAAAYVGSANFLGASLLHSLEAGVEVHGPNVRHVVVAVEAMIRASESLIVG